MLRRRAAIVEVCSAAGLETVILFGSTARGTARRDSDVDLAVAPCGPQEFAHLPRVSEDLARLLGRPVQVEPYALLSAYFKVKIDQDGIVLSGRPLHRFRA